MGATIFGDKVYISQKLSNKINLDERKIVIAHEICHYKKKHRIKILALMLAISAVAFYLLFTVNSPIPAIVVLALFFPITNWYRRRIEIEADRYAIEMTGSFDAFISLMNKLTHDKSTHPSKDERIDFANKLRRKYEYN